MNYGSNYIDRIGNETHFIKANIEKVLRLLDILTFIDNELDPKHETLVLKGGTAINLVYTSLSRLSVDIDLDYIGSLDKEKTNQDRISIMEALDDYMISEGYSISSKSRESAILTSRSYAYIRSSNSNDIIKLDVNFIDRIHVYPEINKSIEYFDKKLTIKVPAGEELFAMKISALLNRSKIRDLYDTNSLKQHISVLNADKIRKLVVFYLSLDCMFTINEQLFDGIKAISQERVKKELYPVISTKETFDLEKN